MDNWKPIETAPKDRVIWVWQEGSAKHWGDEDFPYTPRAVKWDAQAKEWFNGDGERVKGATYWMDILVPKTRKKD